MALTATTIAGAITASENTVKVTSGTSVTAGQFARIDNEYVKIMAVNGTQVDIFRGVRGTQAKSHQNLADFIHGPAADFPVEMFPIAGSYTYSVDGAITVAPGLHKFIKASAIAATLAAPTTAQEGLELTFVSLNAVAHVVTAATYGFTDEPQTATFGGAIGDSFTIVAANGLWNVKYLNNVTIADVS